VKTAEIYSDLLALYGCGDFLNDYDGINGYESDLTLMYLPAIDPRLGQLVEALLVPMRVARFRLNRAVQADAEWLCLRSTYCDLSAQAFKRQTAWSRRVSHDTSRADYIYESINAGTQAMERSKTCGCSIISKQHLQLLNDFTAFLLGAFAE